MKWIAPSLLLWAVCASGAQNFASEDDMLKLQTDLENLEADLASIPAEKLSSEHREAVARIREEVVYLKVVMRKHRESGAEGTGLARDDVRDLRLAIADLRNELRPQMRTEARGEAAVSLASGTEFALRLQDSLTSANASPGDRFTAIAAAPILQGDVVVIEAGSVFHGRVELVDRAGGRTDRTAKLVLAVNEVERGGDRQELSATVIKASERLETGLGSEVGKVGIGAGLGAILGAALGGKTGAIIGASVGGGGAILATEGKEVQLPRGTILHMRLDKDVTFPKSQS